MDKILFESKGGFMKVKSPEKPYFYAERKGVDSVAFILLDSDRDDCYGVTHERKPPMDERYNTKYFLETAFGGSNDMVADEHYFNMNDTEVINHFKELVRIEAKEEAGYSVGLDRIRFYSKEFVSTQMNQWCFLFVVDVTGIEVGERDPQNETEALAEVRWKTLDEINELNDWKTKTILFKMLYHTVAG